jgi:hypothetical protein
MVAGATNFAATECGEYGASAPFLDGLTSDQLLARIGEAEARIEEETAVISECHKRLGVKKP